MADSTPSVQPAPFPAPTKSTSGPVKNILTTVTHISFTDKLLLTVAGPSGKLAHWVHVPLSTASADPMNPNISLSGAGSQDANGLLPRTDLTATTVLGGTKRDDEILGQTLATTVASAILTKRPQEERILVLGLGLQPTQDLGRDGFDEIVGLCLSVL